MFRTTKVFQIQIQNILKNKSPINLQVISAEAGGAYQRPASAEHAGQNSIEKREDLTDDIADWLEELGH